MKIKIITIILFLIPCFLFGQMESYSYKNKLEGIENTWHQITLPADIFGKVKSDFSDIRIYGITKGKDTVETPYLLRVEKESFVLEKYSLEITNKSFIKKGYYFTLINLKQVDLTQIKLLFKNKNFDWKLNLEGSNGNEEWFTIKEDYRILSIYNESMNYRFTTLNFPVSNYKYFRVFIKAKEKPKSLYAFGNILDRKRVKYNEFTVTDLKIEEDKEQKTSIIDLTLENKVPISTMKINILDSFDYYRTIKIQYLADSFQIQKKWKYNYRTLVSKTLSSLEKPEFKFNSTIADKWRIVIENRDNKSLKISGIEVKGYEHKLLVRFIEPANYFLVYGKVNSHFPNYDISRFSANIPDSLVRLNLGELKIIPKKEVEELKPIFENKNWLWAVMIVIIGVLGWFTMRMMKGK